MCERHPCADVEEPCVERRAEHSRVEAEILGGPVQQKRIPRRLRGGGENEQLSLRREQPEPSRKASFDLASHRLSSWNAEPARELRGVPGSRQLEKRERVAMALGDDLLADGRVDRACQVLEQ